MRRRNKYGEVRSIDDPVCCRCKQIIYTPYNLFNEMNVIEMSGAVDEITCDNCGHTQVISMSIEWKTWDADSQEGGE
jgi:hypothetical protein